jgi:hypothetical protein
LGRARRVRARRWVGVGRDLLEKTLCELRSRQRPICSVASQLVEQHAGRHHVVSTVLPVAVGGAAVAA